MALNQITKSNASNKMHATSYADELHKKLTIERNYWLTKFVSEGFILNEFANEILNSYTPLKELIGRRHFCDDYAYDERKYWLNKFISQNIVREDIMMKELKDDKRNCWLNYFLDDGSINEELIETRLVFEGFVDTRHLDEQFLDLDPNPLEYYFWFIRFQMKNLLTMMLMDCLLFNGIVRLL